jgi:hypothetical protein
MEKAGILSLIDISLGSDQKNSNYIFMDKDGQKILKNVKKTKLPNPISSIKTFTEKDVFFTTKGETLILRCKSIDISKNFEDSELVLEKSPLNKETDQYKFKLKELIIRPKDIYINIDRNEKGLKTESKIFEWLIGKQLRTYIYLKKPVNNIEIGYIQEIRLAAESFKKKQKGEEYKGGSYITIKNIFGEIQKIPYKSLETISFEFYTGKIQKKSETSIFSKFGYFLLKKFKPDKIFYLNKV